MNKQYSPGLHKLIFHFDHLKKIINHEIVAPIHVSVWPTPKCQLKCSYCCCRNITDRSKELGLEEFKSTVNVLVKYGTKAIEFSGGGESLLWPYFNEAVRYVYDKGIKLSLITNGFLLHTVPQDILSKFQWIRVSIISRRQISNIDLEYVKKATRVSSSYIIGNDEDLSCIEYLFELAKQKGIIIRVAVQRPSTLQRENDVENKVNKFGEPLFFSKKESGKPLGCYMAWIRAAIDWNGNFLPCPSMQLNLDSEGKIPENFPLCHISNLEEWLKSNPLHDLGYKCKFCNCGKEHNDFVFNLLQGVEDVEFV